MPSVRFLARRFADRTFGTHFDRVMARAARDSRKRFLFFWNRGLGDIALGLVPMFLRIRREIPGARIEVVTREELRDAFSLTGIDALHVVPGLEREKRIDLAREAPVLGLPLADFTAVFDYPDPNRWLTSRRREYPPKLAWQPSWDALHERFPEVAADHRTVIVAHVSSETASFYGYPKDWPAEAWRALIAEFAGGCQWVLVGNRAEPPIEGANVVDLRGRTTLPELLSLIKNRCRVLIAPDSGVLTMAYYLDAPFPLEVISLWSDPRQGILLQDCPSPNAKLRHVALQGPGEDVRKLPVDAVARALRSALDSAAFVEVRGARLECLDIPAVEPGKPDVLLLHEGLGSVSLWRDFPRRLAERTRGRVVAYSRAGFGRSAPRTHAYTPRFMHEEALDVLPDLRRTLGLERPVLVGHSTGASIALLHAAAAPVAGVVAMAPFAFVEESNLAAIGAARERYADLRDRLARHHDDVEGVFFGWSDLWLDPSFRAWDISADVAPVRCPVLLILGERDEYSTAAQLERIAAAVNARVETLRLPESGHAPHRDEPEAVLAAIERFIATLEA